MSNEKGETGRAEHTHILALSALARAQRAPTKAFHQYYAQYAAHENTLAATLTGSVQRDVYYAKARGYPTRAESRRCFTTTCRSAVYDNLIASVHSNLPAVYRYYDLRRRKMKLQRHPPLRHLRADPQRPRKRSTPGTRRSKSSSTSLEPLGDEYCAVLQQRPDHGRWCDRYPNQGKQSGAFSSRHATTAEPYILMNYQPDVLDHVFTLAHEAGPLDAQLLLGQASAVPVLQLHDLRRRGRQHVQRATARPAPDEQGEERRRNGPT